MVELVDVMVTMLDLAGLPPFDPTRKNEPPLEGRSLAPLVLLSAAGSSSGDSDNSSKLSDRGSAPPSPSSVVSVFHANFGFNASYSQYGRSRCPTDLFVARCPGDPELPATKYIGYSVRTYTHRYTRWLVVTTEGTPLSCEWAALLLLLLLSSSLSLSCHHHSRQRLHSVPPMLGLIL